MQHSRNGRGHHTPLSAAHGSRRRRLLGIVPLSALLAACAPEPVSIGSGEGALEASSDNPACPGGILPNGITTTTQAGIDALAGCTEIAGDLNLVSFPGMDLGPLSELRVVRGNVDVGGADNETRRGREVFLHGLENLEEVNSLRLNYVMDSDLAALANLRRIGWQQGSTPTDAGRLRIADCDGLQNLSGLEALTDFGELIIEQNASLASLSGLRPPPALRSVIVIGAAALTDIAALAPVRQVDQLLLSDTGLTNLDVLQLETIGDLNITENDSLISAASLESLTSLESLMVLLNDRLEELPQLSGVNDVRRVSIVGNAELRSVPSFYGYQGGPSTGFGLAGSIVDESWFPRPAGPGPLPPELAPNQIIGFDMFEVAANPRLTRISLPLQGRAGSAVIYGNASLTEIDFGSAGLLNGLFLHNNPMLGVFTVYEALRVVDLRVTDNPQLPTAFFESLPALSRVISGNLPSSAP